MIPLFGDERPAGGAACVHGLPANSASSYTDEDQAWPVENDGIDTFSRYWVAAQQWYVSYELKPSLYPPSSAGANDCMKFLKGAFPPSWSHMRQRDATRIRISYLHAPDLLILPGVHRHGAHKATLIINIYPTRMELDIPYMNPKSPVRPRTLQA